MGFPIMTRGKTKEGLKSGASRGVFIALGVMVMPTRPRFFEFEGYWTQVKSLNENQLMEQRLYPSKRVSPVSSDQHYAAPSVVSTGAATRQ